MFLICPIGPDRLGVSWGLYSGRDEVPEIHSSGSGTVRADLAYAVTWQTQDVLERWASVVEGFVRLAEEHGQARGRAEWDPYLRSLRTAKVAAGILRAALQARAA